MKELISMCNRGFEIVKGYEDKGINLPVRKTKHAAAYDVEAALDVVIPAFKPGIKPTLIPTGLKAYCGDDEWYMLVSRSSGPKKGFVMANGVGIVDSDYYENESNDGHFYFQYFNFLEEDLVVHKGDVIGQVIFMKYLTVDNDKAEGIRKGGFGSTDKK